MVDDAARNVTHRGMWFKPIISRWGTSALASDLGLPKNNVGRWVTFDSIPAEWFAPVARAAAVRGFKDITVELLAARAEARAVAKRASGAPAAQAAA